MSASLDLDLGHGARLDGARERRAGLLDDVDVGARDHAEDARRRAARPAGRAPPRRRRGGRGRAARPARRGRASSSTDEAAVLSAPRRERAARADPARHGRARAARGAARRPGRRGGDGQRARRGLRRARAGAIERTEVSFASEQALRDAIERILAPLGRRVDELSPMADARLADGSRVNVVIPPLAVDGPALSIRRFAADAPGPRRARRVRDARPRSSATCSPRPSRARRSILISGGTGSGKTTLLNALSRFIADGRARDHDRGRRRAPPPAAARRPAREPAAERRGDAAR